MIKYFFLIALSFLISCNNHRSFYEYSTKEDLYRIPLIEPYELITNFGTDDYRHEEPYTTWDLKLIYGHYPFSSARAEGINITNGVIYGYRPGNSDQVERRFVIIPKEREEIIFKDQEKEWRSFLASKGIDSIKFYNVWEVFDKFRSDKTLPWYNPKEGIFPTSDIK
jgi:hypothetical protein